MDLLFFFIGFWYNVVQEGWRNGEDNYDSVNSDF